MRGGANSSDVAPPAAMSLMLAPWVPTAQPVHQEVAQLFEESARGGLISLAAAAQAVDQLWPSLPSRLVTLAFHTVDTQGTQSLDWDGFYALFNAIGFLRSNWLKFEQIHAMGGSRGRLSRAQFVKATGRLLGQPLNASEAWREFSHIDEDSAGYVSVEEFVVWFARRSSGLTQGASGFLGRTGLDDFVWRPRAPAVVTSPLISVFSSSDDSDTYSSEEEAGNLLGYHSEDDFATRNKRRRRGRRRYVNNAPTFRAKIGGVHRLAEMWPPSPEPVVCCGGRELYCFATHWDTSDELRQLVHMVGQLSYGDGAAQQLLTTRQIEALLHQVRQMAIMQRRAKLRLCHERCVDRCGFFFGLLTPLLCVLALHYSQRPADEAAAQEQTEPTAAAAACTGIGWAVAALTTSLLAVAAHTFRQCCSKAAEARRDVATVDAMKSEISRFVAGIHPSGNKYQHAAAAPSSRSFARLSARLLGLQQAGGIVISPTPRA